MVALSFGSNKKPLLGIDIGSSSVKIVEVVEDKSGYVLNRYAIQPLAEDAVQDGVVADTEAVSAAISSALSSMKAKTKDAALCVSGASVITKTILMSNDFGERQLEQEIELEADQHIPFPLDDVSLDFCVLGPSGESDESNDVLLVACRREAIDVVTDICDDANITAKVIDFEPYAQQRVIRHMMRANDASEDAVAAYIDFGATNFRVKFVHNNQVVYTRDQVFGGAQLESDLAASLGLTPEEAKRQMANPDLLPNDVEEHVLAPFRAQVLQQVTRSLQLFFAATNFNDVDMIILGGGVAVMPGLIDLLKEDLGTTVLLANPAEFMDCSKVRDQKRLKREASALMLACGLAIWGGTHG